MYLLPATPLPVQNRHVHTEKTQKSLKMIHFLFVTRDTLNPITCYPISNPKPCQVRERYSRRSSTRVREGERGLDPQAKVSNREVHPRQKS